MALSASGTGYLFLFAILLAAGLLFSCIFFLIVCAEYEDKLIHKERLCGLLNSISPVEHVAPIFLAALFLVSGQWLAFVFTAPVAAYNIRKLRNGSHIFRLDQMKFGRSPRGLRKESFIKAGSYLLLFFVFLYRMIAVLVEASD
ncbi:cornichon [Mycena polygramma]|nr:cornichon [Mycena polygramma]